VVPVKKNIAGLNIDSERGINGQLTNLQRFVQQNQTLGNDNPERKD
jgi:hypothetical protein